MEPIFIVSIVVASFFLGFFVHQKVCRALNSDEKAKNIIKKHRDIANWLKSELVQIKRKKTDKNIDSNKVKLLEILIQRLEK